MKLRSSVLFAVFVAGPLIVFQDLTVSNHDYIPKVIFILGTTIWILITNREGLPKRKIRPKSKRNNLEVSFLIVLTYVGLQSVRAVLLGHSRIGAMYWPLQFAALFVILGIQNRQSLSATIVQANRSNISIYQWFLLVYLSLGRTLIEINGQSFKILNIQVTSKTLLLIPVLIFYPMILNALSVGSTQQKLRSVLILILYIQIAILIADRAVIISVLILIISSVPYLYVHRTKVFGNFLTYVLAVFVAFMVLVQPNKVITETLVMDTSGIITDMPKISSFDGSRGDNVTQIHDLDRFVHLEAAWRTVSEDPFHLVFGFGFREDSFVMRKHLFDLYNTKLSALNINNELGSYQNLTTFGLAAFLVDFGILGVALSLLFGFFLVVRLTKGARPSWSLVNLTTLSLSILYLFKVNFLHYPILYLAISPVGLFVWMAALEQRESNN